jgi:hypothetical protein
MMQKKEGCRSKKRRKGVSDMSRRRKMRTMWKKGR